MLRWGIAADCVSAANWYILRSTATVTRTGISSSTVRALRERLFQLALHSLAALLKRLLARGLQLLLA